MSMRLRLYPLALAALLLAPPAAHASNFTVTPTEVNLSSSATSGLVTLRNGSKTALRFEITLFKWSEDEKGKMTLEPSADVTFFPKLVELAAGASRNIRVGINAGVARDVEQSFRIFIEELPDQSAPAANTVAIRTKVGIPVFVRPTKPARSARDRKRFGRGRQGDDAREATPATCTSTSITLPSRARASSASTFSKEGQGWYVLPGATRIFEVPMTAAECKSTTAVNVEVFGHNTSLKGASQVSPAACAAP